jgi:hypothetical protein
MPETQVPTYRILTNERAWYWYKKELDFQHKEEHDHGPENPEKYPCGVISEYHSGDYGSSYMHTFIYQQIVKCEKCGHTEVIWPAVPEDI